MLAFQIRPHRSPQSDRRNLLNSAHRDFKSKRVERVIDEIGAPPSQHAPCPPPACPAFASTICARGSNAITRRAPCPAFVTCCISGFSVSNSEGWAAQWLLSDKADGGAVWDSAKGSKGRVSKVTLCATPPQGARHRHSAHEQGRRVFGARFRHGSKGHI